MHEDGGVRHGAREIHLVRHQQHGHAALGELFHHQQHLAGQFRIERRGHLVEQHHLGLHGERTGDRDALLLATGEVVGIAVELLGEADLRQHLLGQRQSLRLRHVLGDARREHDVLPHRQMREQVVALEDDADILAQFAQLRRVLRHRVAGDLDLAGMEALEPVDAAQQRRLARTRAADDRDDLSGIDAERDAFQHLQRTEALVDAFNENGWHSSPFRDGG